MEGMNKRMSVISWGGKRRDPTKQPLIIQNTYRMTPTAEERFRPHLAKQAIEKALEQFDLQNIKKYDAEQAKGLTNKINVAVKTSLKELNMPRHKFVVQTVVGQNGGQGFDMHSRAIWCAETDGTVSHNIKTTAIFVVTTMHALYTH